MRAIFFLFLILCFGLAGAQELKSVSNADNNLHKHRQVLASRLLSWSTGSVEQINYVSVGRYANYFGFVKMRVSSAHSLKRSEVGKETLSVLTSQQRDSLFNLLFAQSPLIRDTHVNRIRANSFLNELLKGNPVDRDRFIELARQYAVKESELGIVLAAGFAEIIRTLTPQQKTQLILVRQKHTSGRASKVRANIEETRKLSQRQKQEIFNLAARLLSWSTGDIDDFVYETIGKPSQHFGFVSMRIESNHGVKRGLLANEVMTILTENQRAQLLKAAEADAVNLEAYLSVRDQFLRALASQRDIDEGDVSEVHALAKNMASLEAHMSWDQAFAMKKILNTFTKDQAEQFIELRNRFVPKQNATGVEIYQQCVACHHNSHIAPDLTSIIDRPVASMDYKYSPAMIKYSEQNTVWSEELLSRFLKNPQQTVPGTTMSFKGINEDESLRSLISHLDDIQ